MEYTVNNEKQTDVAILALEGPLVAPYQIAQLKTDVESCIVNGQNHIILDLNHLTYINSTGLNALIHTLTKSRQAGGDTIIAHIPPRLTKLFLITKLNAIFEVEDSIEDALNTINPIVLN